MFAATIAALEGTESNLDLLPERKALTSIDILVARIHKERTFSNIVSRRPGAYQAAKQARKRVTPYTHNRMAKSKHGGSQAEAFPGGKICVNEPVLVKIGAFTHA